MAEPRDAGGRGQPSREYTGDVRGNDLAEALGVLARALEDADGLEGTLHAVVVAAARTVPGAEQAGLTVVRARRRMETLAATDELVRKVDAVQYEVAEGPCLDAVYERRTVRLTDMAGEPRWPAFTGRAHELGIGSMLSFQLFVERDDLGALNLYAAQPGAFGDESEQVGLLFAAHAAVAMAAAQRQHDLTRAMWARDLIGQAKGILMERHRLSAEEAFRLLVQSSQRTNTKLADVARYLTETGEMERDEG